MDHYTHHLVPRQEEILGADMHEVRPSIPAGRPRLEIHPLGIGDRADRVRLMFDAVPVRPWSSVSRTLGPVLLVGNEIDMVESDAPLPKLPVARAVWPPAPDLRIATEAWLTPGGPHHTCPPR
jgi:L-arabinose isomerase